MYTRANPVVSERLAALDPLAGEQAVGSRIGVLQVVLTLGTGGTERLVVEICRRLRQRFAMAVCTLDEPGTWAPTLEACGIGVISLHRRPGFHPSIGWRIAEVARRANATILHCHHYSPFVYSTIARARVPGGRLVFTEHGRLSDGPPSLKRRLVNPVLGRAGAAMFAVSSALRDSMRAEGYPADRITVVPNGIDAGPRPAPSDRAAARRRLGLSPDHLVVGTIARLNPVKDLGTLIRAFADFRRIAENATLVIIGDGEERAQLESAVRDAALADDVLFLGERDDARALLPAFDVFANSSISEGVSLTILEAMAAELPVVATRVGGTPEVIEDGLTGLLVPARNPQALARALAHLSRGVDARRTLGARARTAVEQRFTIDRMVEHYAQVYRRLAR
jgi:glycosyltransferase involved in cell wall biosynthesis